MIIDGKLVLFLAQVVDRIKKDAHYVRAEIEDRKFQLVIVEKRANFGTWRAFYYSDKAAWPFDPEEDVHHTNGTPDFHYLLRKDSVFRLLEDSIEVFIPLDAVRQYQKDAEEIDLSKIIPSKKYTPLQVSKFIKRSRKRVYELIDEGVLKSIKRGGGPRARREILGSVILAYLGGCQVDQ